MRNLTVSVFVTRSVRQLYTYTANMLWRSIYAWWWTGNVMMLKLPPSESVGWCWNYPRNQLDMLLSSEICKHEMMMTPRIQAASNANIRRNKQRHETTKQYEPHNRLWYRRLWGSYCLPHKFAYPIYKHVTHDKHDAQDMRDTHDMHACMSYSHPGCLIYLLNLML